MRWQQPRYRGAGQPFRPRRTHRHDETGAGKPLREEPPPCSLPPEPPDPLPLHSFRALNTVALRAHASGSPGMGLSEPYTAAFRTGRNLSMALLRTVHGFFRSVRRSLNPALCLSSQFGVLFSVNNLHFLSWSSIRPVTPVYYFSHKNFKVHADIGLSENSMWRHLVVLDTGAGHNCIRKPPLSPGWESALRTNRAPCARSKWSPFMIHGRICLFVRVGRHAVRNNFLVCDSLQDTDAIQSNVYAIYARDRYVRMADGSEAPIVRRPTLLSTQAGTKVERLVKQRDAALRDPPHQPPCGEDPDAGQGRPVLSDKICAAEGVVLQPHSQSWVEAVCSRRGVIVVEPRAALLAKAGISATNGVAQVAPLHSFPLMVDNVGEKPYHLCKGTVVAHANRTRY